VTIPPALFYAIAALLIAFGGLRVYHFGWRRSRRDLVEDTPSRRSQRRSHVIGGVLWVILGTFLALSTAGIIRFRF